MSEASPGESLDAVVSGGALLREARERAGMHIGALAVGLKVPVKKIEALEGDRFDLLPDAVFARALASSIARTLKVDPAPILAALPQSQPRGLEVGGMVSRIKTEAATQPAMGAAMSLLKKPAVLIGGLLVIGALALVFAPMSEAPTSNHALGSSGADSVTVGQTGSDAAANLPKNASYEVPNAMSGQTVLPAAVPASGPVMDASAMLGGGAEVQAKSGNSGLIVLNASGPTWVEVTDAAGVVQLRKTLAAGENTSAGGILPLKVVVGRVDATQVLVRGKAFDMAPFGKDNVARFEVR
jgi:cytoskeleton protein RodZ